MEYASLKAHSDPITSLVFTYQSGENLVSDSLDGTVRLWKVSTGEMLHTFSASGMGSVYSVAISINARHILSGSEDGTIRMRDTKHRDIPPKIFVGHTGKVNSLSVAYTGRRRCFASGSSDGTIQVWGAERDHAIEEGSAGVIAALPDGGYLVSGSDDGTASIWRIETGSQVKGPLKRHNGKMTSLAFSPDGLRFASGPNDGTVIIRNLEGDSVACSCKERGAWAICFSLDGKHLASGANNRIQVWDSKNGKLTFNPSEGHLDPSRSICYSPDGDRIVSGSSDKTICIWDASSSTLLLTWQGHPDGNFFVTYSYDGSYILSRCKDGSIQVRDAYNGKLVRELIKAHEDCVTSICFSQ